MEKISTTLVECNNKRFITLKTNDSRITDENSIIIAQGKNPKQREKHKDSTGEERLDDLKKKITDTLLNLKKENGETIIAKVYFEGIGLTIMAHDPLDFNIINLLWNELSEWIYVN